ncbi:DNA methyltransferase [Vibrio rotiferianus]|uniref:DNA methyltransferase n=1 Tax=Vibrio rotiferianus TaxID=190895 RepID=UPI00406A3E14
MLVINPKRSNELADTKPHWYNYYAGYSHAFTQGVINSLDLAENAVILDPWNGSGTTTLASSMSGYRSFGVDLNPAMKVIASAKQSTPSDVADIASRTRKVRLNRKVDVDNDDPLFDWFDESGVNVIRKIEAGILEGKAHSTTTDKIDSLLPVQCLMFTALFNCVRETLSAFIPSNPTWIKKPKSDSERVSLSWDSFRKNYISHLNTMIQAVEQLTQVWDSSLSQLKIGSSSELPLPDKSVDLVITSPPYCTRIDYGVATYPELSIIAVGGRPEIDLIRRGLMGTTTVPKNKESLSDSFGATCVDFLRAVQQHPSKASETYYLKNFIQYFSAMNTSMSEISRTLKDGAQLICVVQDSFYKDVHCDLSQIIIDMSENHKLKLLDKHHFESKQNMANLNNKSKLYRAKTLAIETVLIFERE